MVFGNAHCKLLYFSGLEFRIFVIFFTFFKFLVLCDICHSVLDPWIPIYGVSIISTWSHYTMVYAMNSMLTEIVLQ